MSRFECAATSNGHYIVNHPFYLKCGHLACGSCIADETIRHKVFYCHKCGASHDRNEHHNQYDEMALGR